jgi:uncharacterized protein YoxC
MTTGSRDITDPERRALMNAQGALEVVRTASVEVDDGLSGIDERMTRQADEMGSVLADVSDLSASVEQLAANAQEIDERTTRAAERVEAGRTAATNAMDGMSSVRTSSQTVAENVERLRTRIDAVEDALDGIDEIADQTNLLALNASIEAARSDGDGQGFAVVADEIKTLAAESQALADEIGTILDEVREATDDTVSRLDTAIEEIGSSAEQVERAVESLGEIVEVIDETSSDVSAMSDVTDEQARVSESVANRCEEAADRADHIEDRIAAIRAAREEQTAMLREIADAIEAATPGVVAGTEDTVAFGTPSIDDRTAGIVLGGRGLLRCRGTDTNDLLARLCATALDEGLAVSLTPPPGLDRATLASALGTGPEAALDANRLFVIDAFGEWQSGNNVFDLETESLSAVNEKTVRRRTEPLLIVGNIQAEISELGEQRAREARYENDSSVFEARDTVLNVVNDETVDETFAAFYAGAADQVFEVEATPTGRQLRVRESPTGDDGTTVPLASTADSRP